MDEDLPDFFNALKVSDKDWFKSENGRMKDQYAFMVANQETLDIMRKYGTSSKQPITNLPFYYVLGNPHYQRMFNYFPTTLLNREKYIIDKDC